MSWFGLGSQVDERIRRYVDLVASGGGGVPSHGGTHVDGGSDEIDGDKLSISWVGYVNYVPSTSPSEVDSLDDLTAHLYGIDQALSSVGSLLGLSDTPGSYAGWGRYPLVVNVGETGVEFVNDLHVNTLLDGSGNNVLKLYAGSGTVANYMRILNAAAGVAPQLGVTGSDTDISLNLTVKGAGRVQEGGVNVCLESRSLLSGEGLSGGGDLSVDRTLSVDVNGLLADGSPDGALDYVMTYDASAGSHKKVLLNDLPSAGGVSDHGLLTGLGDDDHSQYGLLLGRTGGQTLIGGLGAGDDLRLQSTSSVTKGLVYLGSGSGYYYDEANDILSALNLGSSGNRALQFGGSGGNYLTLWASSSTDPVQLRLSTSSDSGISIRGKTGQNTYVELLSTGTETVYVNRSVYQSAGQYEVWASDLSGTTFPASPSDGDFFYRTDLSEWFFYDGTNSVWLGEERHTIFGKGGTGLNNEYLRCGHAIGTSARGWLLPYDIAVVGVSASWTSGATSGNIIVRRDGVNVLSSSLLTFGTTTTTLMRTGAYATADKHDGSTVSGTMQVYLDNLNAAINHVNVMVMWRRRET